MLNSILNNIVLSSTLVNLSKVERQDPKAQEIFSRLSLGFQVKIAFDLLEKAFPKHFEHYPLTNRVRLLCYSLPLISLLIHKLLKKTQLQKKYAYIDSIFQKTGTASKVAIIFASYQLAINDRQMESGLVLVVLAFSTLNSRKVINFDNSKTCRFPPKMVQVIGIVSQVMGLFHTNNIYKLSSGYALAETIVVQGIPFYFPLREDKQTEAETIALLQAQEQIKSENAKNFDVPEVAFNMDYLKNLRTIPAYFKFSPEPFLYQKCNDDLVDWFKSYFPNKGLKNFKICTQLMFLLECKNDIEVKYRSVLYRLHQRVRQEPIFEMPVSEGIYYTAYNQCANEQLYRITNLSITNLDIDDLVERMGNEYANKKVQIPMSGVETEDFKLQQRIKALIARDKVYNEKLGEFLGLLEKDQREALIEILKKYNFKSLEPLLKAQWEFLLRENPKRVLDNKTYAELHILGYLQNRREQGLKNVQELYFWIHPKALHSQLLTVTFGRSFGLPIQNTEEAVAHLGYALVKIQKCIGWFNAKILPHNVTGDLYFLAAKVAKDEIPFSVIRSWWVLWCDQNGINGDDRSRILTTLATEKNKLRELLDNSDLSFKDRIEWFEKSETFKLYKKMLLEMKFLIPKSSISK